MCHFRSSVFNNIYCGFKIGNLFIGGFYPLNSDNYLAMIIYIIHHFFDCTNIIRHGIIGFVWHHNLLCI